MAKIWNVTVDRMASTNGHVVMTAKDGSYGVTAKEVNGTLDIYVDFGSPTPLQELEALNFARVHGWI